MRNNLLFFLLIQFIFLPGLSYSQEVDSPIVVNGQILNATSKKPISFAHIKVKRKGCIADSLGFFSLACTPKDSLKISAIGYGTLKIPLLLHQANWNFLVLELQATSYQLGEVEIFAFSSYDEFKRQFIASKLPEPEFKINESILSELAPYSKRPPTIIPPMYRSSFREKPGFWNAIITPTDFLYYHVSRKERSKQKVAQMIRQEKKQKNIQHKYNAELIASITKLHGETLVEFIAYCNSKIEVESESSDYAISSQIHKLLEEYQSKKTKAKG